MALPFSGPFTFTSDDMWLSEFRLLPSDPSWNAAASRRTTDEAVLIAFPRTSVAIRHQDRPEIVADPLSAVVYSPGQPYRRRLVTAVGDDCTILAVAPDLAHEVVNDLEAGIAADGRFPFSASALERADYMSIERLRYRLASSADVAQDTLREELLWLLGRVMVGGYGSPRSISASAPSAIHVDLAQEVRHLIGRDLTDSVSLAQLAVKVSVSPFHLVRVFRSVTGHPIHAYRIELRLRASLPLIADGVRLADVAQLVGFASHAHLTDRFARAFGVTPAAWRDELRSSTEPRNSKNLVAKDRNPLIA